MPSVLSVTGSSSKGTNRSWTSKYGSRFN